MTKLWENQTFCHVLLEMSSKATIRVEFQTQVVEIDGKEVKAQISDTAGQERFRAVTSAYYRGAVGALLVYDISRRSSFDSVKRWLDELTTHCDTTVARMVVGNKCDLENIIGVSVEEGKALQKKKAYSSWRHLPLNLLMFGLLSRLLSGKSTTM